MTDSQIIELHDKLREKKSKDYTEQEAQYQKFFFAWGINCKEFRKKLQELQNKYKPLKII